MAADETDRIRAFARELKNTEGLSISEEGIAKLAKVGGFRKKEDVWKYLSDRDLRTFGERNFPNSMMTTEKIAGVRVVQIQNFRDICRPTTKEPAQCGKGRMLWLLVSDAKSCSYEFLEFEPCPKLNVKKLFPGVKLQVADLEVKRGICCLKPDNIIRIFGQVEALQEGWIVRTKFKEKAAFLRSLKDGEKPPPEFKPFNEKQWLRDKKKIKRDVEEVDKRDPTKQNHSKTENKKDIERTDPKEEEEAESKQQDRDQSGRNKNQGRNDRNKNRDRNQGRNDRNENRDRNQGRNDRNENRDRNQGRNDRNKNRDRNQNNQSQDIRHGDNRGGRNNDRSGRNQNRRERNQNRDDNYRNNNRDDNYRNNRDDNYRNNRDDNYRGNNRRGNNNHGNYRNNRNRNNREDNYRNQDDQHYQNQNQNYHQQEYPPMGMPYQPTPEDMNALYQLGITQDLGMLSQALTVCHGNREQAVAYLYSVQPYGAPPGATDYFNPMG